MGQRVREQGHVAGALDGDGDDSLVLLARACLAARLDLAAVADEHAQPGDVLIVDASHVIGAEAADLAAAAKASRGTAVAVALGAIPTWSTVTTGASFAVA
jgi:hypothetical protein